MAYIITINNNVFKIAANENEKNDLNTFFPPAEAINISDADFLKIKKNKTVATISGNTVSFTDVSNSFESEENLKNYINNLKELITAFLNPNTNNNNKILYSTINSYYNTLDNFDTSTITFPLNKSWEEYCEENSITYIHSLQIP